MQEDAYLVQETVEGLLKKQLAFKKEWVQQAEVIWTRTQHRSDQALQQSRVENTRRLLSRDRTASRRQMMAQMAIWLGQSRQTGTG